MKGNAQTLTLTDQQERAVTAQDRQVLVAAGAGSGKTMTLVARYLELLSQGHSPRQIAAITFTEKAAREMRNRVRRRVIAKSRMAETESEKNRWGMIESKMDAARIGTIHSLCAEILRAHPAQARIDPAFEVIEEGIAATLRAQAVEDALAWGVGEEAVAQIYLDFTAHHLEGVLRFLLSRRLDASARMRDPQAHARGEGEILAAMAGFLHSQPVAAALDGLRSLHHDRALEEDAGGTLAGQVERLLSDWATLEAHLASEELLPAADTLFSLRRERLKLSAGRKDSRAKEWVRDLQSAYDEQVNPWLGGARSTDPPPSEMVEVAFSENLPRLEQLYHRALEIYRGALDSRYALDFDDLEHLALELLLQPQVRDFWRDELRAVLVDEYQDTNHRQQEIIRQLQGDLFVVGDARQSIYRFRGADLTVFREMQHQLEERGGKLVRLDMSFRAHPQLSRALDGLLAPIFSEGQGPLYKVPFEPLQPQRHEPRDGVTSPFVEILAGIGPSAAEARPVAARTLAQRLLELKGSETIRGWDEVGVLFRASAGFPYYEDEFEAAGIPFVTIAGGGFYNRPEVRDLLNMLEAIADPTDDLAMAGLLRSPAFGLSDSALYLLRWRGETPVGLWKSLEGDLSALNEQDREHARRAREKVAALLPLVDRLPVVELLNRLVNETDYRAALASAHSRLLYNLDKLILDAHRSNLIRVRAFLEYVQSLHDVGAREGEAPIVESGAVQLMTIHKAKGLQFPFVVLADAGRSAWGGNQEAYLSEETGLAFSPDRVEGVPLITRYAHHLDRLESQAERDRLLYVALTRAAEKLLISGHLTESNSQWRSAGWLRDLTEQLGLELAPENQAPREWSTIELSNGESVGLMIGDSAIEILPLPESATEWPDSPEPQLYKPIPRAASGEADPERAEEDKRDWRATGRRMGAPAVVVGRMVHEALRRWKFPTDPSLERYLEAVALDQGLVEVRQRQRAIAESVELLQRFWGDERREQIEGAPERYHEIPFSSLRYDETPAIGVIDLLYRDENGWTIVDFKTDELHDEDDLDKLIRKGRTKGERPGEHRTQLFGYKAAVESLLPATPQLYLCYLNYQGGVRWVPLEG